MDLRPHINDPVVLRDEGGREYRSRVEGLEPGLLTVARPLDLLVEPALGPGAELLVTWICPRGIAVLPARIVDAHVEGGVSLWSMAITAEGWVEQRRRYVRVPATGPLTLRPLDGQVEPVPGYLVDVSEAALRCAVDAAAADDAVAEGVEVAVTFGLGDREFQIPGRVGFRRPTSHATGRAELVVLFDEPVADADALRKQIFAQQLRNRGS